MVKKNEKYSKKNFSMIIIEFKMSSILELMLDGQASFWNTHTQTHTHRKPVSGIFKKNQL